MESERAPIDVAEPEDAAPTSAVEAGSKIVVLVVDDARSNRQFVGDLVMQRGLADECLFAEDGLVAFKMLRSSPVDLVVCDLDMPRCDGLKFLRLKATDPAFDNVPVVVVTGAEDVSRKVQALTSGASDYVVKPYEPNELAARIGVHLKLRRLQAELLRANTELQRLAQLDPLTEVANRRALAGRLEEEYLRSKRYDRPMSVAMLDIDNFKRLNDSHGHPAGDYALVQVANLCKLTLRRHDFIARYGGEEFVMVLPETPVDSGILACERVRIAVEEAAMEFDGQKLDVTVSLGVASFPHNVIGKPQDLIALADTALYDAKRSGRNRTVAAI